MKPKRSSEGAPGQLWRALLGSAEGATIPDAAWDFTRCTTPAEAEACYLYEYSLESRRIVEELLATRKRIAWRERNRRKIDAWLQANPRPDQKEKDGLAAWIERAFQALPNVVPHTRLSGDLHFLVHWGHFPNEHWLDIGKSERAEIAKGCDPERERWGSEPVHMARRRMLIMPLDQVLANGLGTLLTREQFSKVPQHSGDFVFSFCWPRSNRLLLQDFKRWLEETRPKNRPPLEQTKDGVSRRTTARDYLKALGALRLLRAFDQNFERARAHAYERMGKLLYKDQSAWLKAAKRARSQIEDFQERMVRRRKTFG